MARLKIDPVVIFNILDHYIRRNDSQDSVIGALLGGKAPDGCMEVRNSLPVPHSQSSEQLSIDVEFQRIMKELYQKVDPKNVIIGWYSTSYTENSRSLHDFYEKNIPNFIHVLVDPTLKNGTLNIKALISQPLAFSGMPSMGPFFREVAFEWKTLDAEAIAFASMMRSRQQKFETDDEEAEEEPTHGMHLWDTLQATMNRLHSNLEIAHTYTTKVRHGELKEDKTIGRSLYSVISQIPMSSSSSFDKVFNDSLQDMLMVVYLSKLSKCQLLLNEALQNTFSTPSTNTFMMQQQQLQQMQ
eukprot:RCo049532